MTHVNDATRALIQSYEQCHLNAYLDAVGVWTIGWGTTSRAGVGISPRAGMTITQAQADAYFEATLEKFGAEMDRLITRPINENQRGGYLSFVYNVGSANFATSSSLRQFNAGNVQDAADRLRL
ncbi:lysozyme [Loktanella sp. M215]|uniref:lysozyme n=1 Tax=Loktanella sp. M215 TaxID=2675431 RepID=UPI001F3446E1|nr:lysozyme [Loktanella sp. M215]